MSTSSPSPWLPRLLFLLAVTLSAALAGLVWLAPLFDAGETATSDGDRVLAAFARDVTLRRTALASAAGLLVTACVFFRVPVPVKRTKSSKLPPPPDIAGA